MSDSDTSSGKKQAKKRTRNPSEWKREKRKRLRIAGKSYVNSKGDVVKERKIGEDCKCRRKCYNRVPEDQRNKLFDGYYSLKSHDEQNAYLFGLIRKHDIARKRCKESDRRTCSYKYYVRIRGKEVQVCRLAFAHIHGISPHKIRILCQKQDQNVMFPRDGRGKHNNRPRKIADEVLCQIKDHIYSIISSDRVCHFLKDEKHSGPDLNITKMWKDYLEKYDPNFKEIFSGSSEEETTKELNDISLEPEGQLMTGFSEADLSDNQEPSFPSTVDLSKYPISTYSNSFALLTPCAESQFNGSEIDDPSAEQDGERRQYAPIVKHWLYSKVYHEEFTLGSLKKKLPHLKDSKPTVNQQGNKSERKQRTPKRISREGEPAQSVNVSETVLTVSPFQPIIETSPELQNFNFGQCSDMYIVPFNLQDLSQLPQTSDITTQSQPAMQFNLHTFSTQSNVLSPLVNVSGPAPSIQCSNVVSLPAGTVNFTQNSCGYMNLNMAAFY